MSFTVADIAGMIDHSMLKPTFTVEQLDAGCELARENNVASVCLMPFHVCRCADILQGSEVRTCTVIGFPNGGHTTAAKRAEAEDALSNGCQELDMVVNVNQVLSGNWGDVSADIKTVTEAAHHAEATIKVIFENCYLTDDQKKELCRICTDLGVNWVKTSTGFGTSGAKADDLQLMVEHTREPVQVKASGGIRDLDTILRFRAISPRITRCGASATEAILAECRSRLGQAE